MYETTPLHTDASMGLVVLPVIHVRALSLRLGTVRIVKTQPIRIVPEADWNPKIIEA